MARRHAQLAPVSGVALPATGPGNEPAQARQMRGVARGGALSLVGSGVSAVFTLATTLVVTHGLTQREAGQFFAATSLFLLAESIVISGATTGVVYFIARARSTGHPVDVRRSLWRAAVPVLVASFAVTLTSPAWGPTMARWLSGRQGALAESALVLLFLALPFAATSDLSLAATTGFATMRPTVAVERVGRPLVQFVAVAAVVGTHNPVYVALAWVGPYLLSSLAAVAWLGHLVRSDTVGDVDAGTDSVSEALSWRRFWSFTGPRGLATVAQLMLQRLDIVLVGVLKGPVDAALYTAATRFLVVGQLVANSLVTVVQPRMASWFATGDTAAVARVYQVAAGWSCMLVWPFYLCCAWLAPYWLVIFGRHYTSASLAVEILAVSMLFASATGLVSLVLIMAGRTTWNLVDTAGSLAVNVGLDVWLIPRLGILGAAIGWSAAIVVSNGVPLAQIWHSLRLHPFGSGVRTVTLLCGVWLAALPAVVVAVAGRSLASMLIACTVGVVAYLVGIRRVRATLDLSAFAVSWKSRVRP